MPKLAIILGFILLILFLLYVFFWDKNVKIENSIMLFLLDICKIDKINYSYEKIEKKGISDREIFYDDEKIMDLHHDMYKKKVSIEKTENFYKMPDKVKKRMEVYLLKSNITGNKKLTIDIFNDFYK